MASRSGGKAVDLWSEMIATEEEEEFYDNRSRSVQPKEPEIAVIYRRTKAPNNTRKDVVVVERRQSNPSSGNSSRLSFAVPQRVSWNRSLSTRGRTSIAVAACGDQPQQRKTRRKQKPPLPRGKNVPPANYDKERAYFQEVDAFELLVESPSPKKSGTWIMGNQTDHVVLPHLSSVLRKWLILKKINNSYGLPNSLSKILETPGMVKEFNHGEGQLFSSKTLREASLYIHSGSHSNISNSSFMGKDVSGRDSLSEKSDQEICPMDEDGCHDIEVAVDKLSLTSRPSGFDRQSLDPFFALLAACGQSAPSQLSDVLFNYCDPESIVKVGEGTYGEAFKVGETVCKIVPFDGDLRVNGEVQKRSEEVFEEVILSRTLNHLRGHEGDVTNACTTFIRTLDLRVCQGLYESTLIRVWEEWDRKHGSENDHPKEFPKNQRYVLFIQEHGGQDLEKFVLLNFDEARSLLVQVTFALAVAEAAYEFEHRDLHWGNILLSRKGSGTLKFTLESKEIQIRTFGLVISIIDFTLSRINTGEDILFLDLSSDPELFEGPKGDRQADTYRKMKDVTDECWEESFPKTNVLWLQYLIDILLLKKSYDRTSKDERELRSLKKRMNSYGSAREATEDPFFGDLIVNE